MALTAFQSSPRSPKPIREGAEILPIEYISNMAGLEDWKAMAFDSSDQNSFGDSERRISIDPVSLKQSTRRKPPLQPLSIPSPNYYSNDKEVLPPAKPKFISHSLPGSATSSPRSGSSLMKNLKKWRYQGQASPLPINSLARQQSAAVSRLVLQQHEPSFQRSKSCSEASAFRPSVELDLWSPRISRRQIETQEDDEYVQHGNRFQDNKSDPVDEKFKCGACLFLPGLGGKAKQVRPRRDDRQDEVNVISRAVSLEKFECGSWASSAIVTDDEGSHCTRLYFDLPLELIRNTANDAHSPVTAAFVFDGDRKGGLKKNPPRKSTDSNRHVRFSTSSPTSYPSSPCITPRLRKARAEFNAYLEQAQRA